MSATPSPDRVDTALDNYVEFSAQISGITRSLGLAAVAIIWLFSGGLDSGDATAQSTLSCLKADTALFIPFVTAIIALTCDVLQYAAAAAIWGLIQWALAIVEAGGSSDAATFKKVYPVLVFSGFATDLEHETGTIAKSPNSNVRRERLRTTLNHPDNDKVVTDVLSAPDISGRVALPAAVLFTLKIVALSVSYLAILVYVIHV